MWKAKAIFINVSVGLLLAGPLAALALVIVPASCRGPAVPWAVAALTIALVFVVRRPGRSSH